MIDDLCAGYCREDLAPDERPVADFERSCAWCNAIVPLCFTCRDRIFICWRCHGDRQNLGREHARDRAVRRMRHRAYMRRWRGRRAARPASTHQLEINWTREISEAS